MYARLQTVIVDDDNLFRRYLTDSLSAQGAFRMLGAGDGRSVIDILDNNTIDCIILNYNLGAETGLQIGEQIKNKYPDPPPIIMLTGEGGERTVINAFRGGFSDFVSKRNFALNELVDAVRGAVARKTTERSERVELDRLAELSGVDRITGLYSANFMKERVRELAGSAGRRGGPYGVIEIRLDQLEAIRDRFGQAMHNRALQAFASRLRAATSKTDICGRNCSASFLYLIERDANPQTLRETYDRLSRALSFEANFDAASFKFTPSITAALWPLETAKFERLLGAASTLPLREISNRNARGSR
jgi:two-component system cell cycle response regulator